MTFLREGSAAIVLVTLTLSLQCAGMAAVISWARPSFAPGVLRLGPIRPAMLMMRLMTAFICLHVLEILLWTVFYRWLCFPAWESAFYFSAASYATVGYGDVVLPQVWRTLGPVESIIGVLMCGLSASFLFAIVSRLIDREAQASDTPIKHSGGKAMAGHGSAGVLRTFPGQAFCFSTQLYDSQAKLGSDDCAFIEKYSRAKPSIAIVRNLSHVVPSRNNSAQDGVTVSSIWTSTYVKG
jgi:voltage-gated potassium channel